MTDTPAADIFAVITATATSSSHKAATGFSIMESMVSYLRSEAALADEKAKRLRKQADEIADQFGITEESQQIFEINATEMAPLNEKGLPKYKGKKRGRKPKVRKRQTKSDRPKRQHTGYTFFMQETYPSVKMANPHLAPKELISLVAKLWKNLATAAKTEWKERAERTNNKSNIGKLQVGIATTRSKNLSNTSFGEVSGDRDIYRADQEYKKKEEKPESLEGLEDKQEGTDDDDDDNGDDNIQTRT